MLTPIRRAKAFWKWYAAGIGTHFMARPVKNMTRDELIAVIGCLVGREHRQREAEERRQQGVLARLRCR